MVIVQAAQLIVAWRLWCIAGIAVATIVASTELMNRATATMPKMSGRDRSRSGVEDATSEAGCSGGKVVNLPNNYELVGASPLSTDHRFEAGAQWAQPAPRYPAI